MTQKNLLHIISKGEGSEIEFKTTFNQETKIDDLKTDNYQAQSRNKLITEAFYLTKDIEKYGSGYYRVRKEVKNYPTLKFEYKEISTGFLVTLSYTEQKTVSENVSENVTDRVTDVLDNVPNVVNRVTDNQFRILKLMKQNPYITTNNLSDLIGISQRKIKVNIAKLKKLNKLKRIGSEKTGHWEII